MRTRAYTGAACAALLLACTVAQALMVYATAVSGAINSVVSGLGNDLQAETELAYGRFAAHVDLGYSMADPDDGADLWSLTVDLLPKCPITDTWGKCAYHSRNELDLDPGDAINLESCGPKGSYRTSGFEASLLLGKAVVNGLSSVDTTDYGLRLCR